FAVLGWRTSQWKCKGIKGAIINKTANNISAFITEKQRVKRLYLAVRANTATWLVGQALAQHMHGTTCQMTDIGGQIHKGCSEAKISNHAMQSGQQTRI